MIFSEGKHVRWRWRSVSVLPFAEYNDSAYKDRGAFEFTGKIEKITFQLTAAK